MSRRCDYIRKEYTVSQLAYMAGIMDGEGTFYIGNYSGNRKNGDKHFQTIIIISCIDECLINWLYNTFGGSKSKYTPNQMAKNCRRQVYKWYAQSNRMLHICEEILPYLVIKKRQCEIMIEIRKTYNDLHNIKGRQRVQNLPKEVLELRQSLMDELRNLHIRHIH
jgi:hypothetical protein